MRKYLIAFALMLFIVTFTSCDVMLGGKNAFGVDATLIEEAIKSTTIKEEEKPQVKEETNRKTNNGKTETVLKKFTTTTESGEEKELFSVGKTKVKEESGETPTNVISIGTGTKDKDGNEESITIELPNSKVDLSNVEAILPEKNIDDVVTALEGKGKEQILEELKKEVTDEETKKAAKGTATVIQAVLEETKSSLGESTNKEVKETLDKIVEGLEKVTTDKEEDKKEITQGDVVILQALSNLVYSSTDDILELINPSSSNNSSEEKTEEEKEADKEKQKEAVQAVLDKANDSAMGLVSVINKASSSSPIFNDVDISSLISSFTGNSENNK